MSDFRAVGQIFDRSFLLYVLANWHFKPLGLNGNGGRAESPCAQFTYHEQAVTALSGSCASHTWRHILLLATGRVNSARIVGGEMDIQVSNAGSVDRKSAFTWRC
jgi:hypothetical protein